MTASVAITASLQKGGFTGDTRCTWFFKIRVKLARKPKKIIVPVFVRSRQDCHPEHEMSEKSKQTRIQPTGNPEMRKRKAEEPDNRPEAPSKPKKVSFADSVDSVKESGSSGLKAERLLELSKLTDEQIEKEKKTLNAEDVPKMKDAYQHQVQEMLNELDFVIRLKSILKEGVEKHLSVVMVQLRGTLELINEFVRQQLSKHEGLATSDDLFNIALIKTAFPMDPILNELDNDLWTKVIKMYAKLWQGDDIVRLDEETGHISKGIRGNLSTDGNVSQRNVELVDLEKDESTVHGSPVVVTTHAEVHECEPSSDKGKENEPPVEKSKMGDVVGAVGSAGEQPNSDDWDENYVPVQRPVQPVQRGGRGRAALFGRNVNRGGLINDPMNRINSGNFPSQTRGRGRGRSRAMFPAYYGNDVELPPPGWNQPYAYTTEDWDREFLEREKSCFKCHDKTHLLRDCPLVAKNKTKKRPKKDGDGAPKKKFKKSKKKPVKKVKKTQKKKYKARKVAKSSSSESSGSSSLSDNESSSSSSGSESASSSDSEKSQKERGTRSMS